MRVLRLFNSGGLMKWSRFVHAFPGYGFLWHALKMERLIVKKETIARFSRNAPVPPRFLNAEHALLASKEFIVPESDDPEPCLKNILNLTDRAQEIRSLFLMLSTKCNLDCAYCLFGAAQSGSLAGTGNIMSQQVAREAIELFAGETQENNREAPGYREHVTFYGGEPLLNPDGLKQSVSLIRELERRGHLHPNPHLVINTNGTLLTTELLEFLRGEGVEIQVSVDGPGETHDSNRVDHAGRGSFQAVLSGLQLMRSMDIDFVPLITLIDANMSELQNSLLWLYEQFRIRRYGLNLLMHTRGTPDQNYGERAAQAMHAAHRALEALGVVDIGYGGSFELFTRRAIEPESCGASRKLVVFPHGGVHTCQALEASGMTRIGQLPALYANSSARVKWGSRSRFRNPDCLECPAVGGCGGGCGASAYNATGDIQGIDPNHCSWMKAVFRMWLEQTT
ncbi:MAG: radical SAM protein [bacterium]